MAVSDRRFVDNQGFLGHDALPSGGCPGLGRIKIVITIASHILGN